jgi:uncharacterized membrane protein
MKKFRNIAVIFILTFVLGGCAIYGGPTHRQGPNQATYSTVGVVSGAVLGAMTGDPRIAVLGGVAGAVLGMEYGRQRDRSEAAVGMTDCRAVIHRTYNRDGTIKNVSRNDEWCRSGMSVPGYRVGYNQ